MRTQRSSARQVRNTEVHQGSTGGIATTCSCMCKPKALQKAQALLLMHRATSCQLSAHSRTKFTRTPWKSYACQAQVDLRRSLQECLSHASRRTMAPRKPGSASREHRVTSLTFSSKLTCPDQHLVFNRDSAGSPNACRAHWNGDHIQRRVLRHATDGQWHSKAVRLNTCASNSPALSL